MSYYNFVIKNAHKIVWNVYDREVSTETDSLKYLENFYVTFQKFFQVSVLLYSSYSSTNDIDYIELGQVEDFCIEYYNDCESFTEIFNEIQKIEIKNYCRKYPHKK